MTKKRKSRASQPSQDPEGQEQVPIDESHEQIEGEQQINDDVEQEGDEDNENDEQEEEDEEEETGLNEGKQVKVEANGGGGGGGGGTEDLEEEPLEKLLEPFSKEQLTLLLKEAVSKYPQFISSVQKIADADPAHRKIFVHGLGWDASSETLTKEFGKYGEIEDCKAVVDKVSGKSKGYAFILFKHRSGAKRALKEPQKKIGTRMTSCQLASAGPVPAPPPVAPPVSEYTQRKIFVSNVSAELDPQKLLEFFSQFGEIEDGPLGLDKQTGKPKGFTLFVYKSIESAKKALEEPHKDFEGHTLHCQKAVDGPKINKPYFQQQQQNQHYGGHHHPSKKGKYSGAGGGHLMAPSGPPVGYSPAIPPPALTPALGQALTALLATQGAGLGISNLLGQGMQPMNNSGYGNQGGATYGSQPGMQGGYPNPQMGQGGNRPQQGGASYMGHGH